MSDITLIEDLANQNLTEVPEKVLNLTNLKMLYLEGNYIEEIPDNLFKNLKQLAWLDLRNNKLKTIPSSIIYHTHLETLLLQNNKITRVPQEIGFVPKLSVLQLAGNPLVYPEKSIIEKGVKAIVKFLQNEYLLEKTSNSSSTSTNFSEANDFHENDVNQIKCVIKEKPENERKKNEIPIITLKSYHRFMHQPTRKKDKTRKFKKSSVKSKSTLYKNTPYSNSNKSLKMLPKKKNEIRIQEQFMKDLWLKNLKEIMTKQQDDLQREHDQAVLKNWRRTQINKNIADVRYRPEVPYDYDQDYDHIPTRQELLLKRIEKAQKRIQQPGNAKKINIDHMINDIIESLKQMEREKNVAQKSPTQGMEEAGREIKRILALQKRISTLKLHNDKTL